MKYAIYARVSPRGSSYEIETTINMQIQYCKDYIASQRGEVVEIQSDEFFSGKDMKRPAFRKLMDDMRNGTADWDILCVYKLSRMTRSSRDGALIFDDLRAYNKGFVSATEPAFDFSTPMGRAMLSIFQAFNQFEREQTGENTKNKMISIAASGGWPAGKAPFGYVRAGKHDNTLKIDPRAAEQVRAIFNGYASNASPHQLAKTYRKPVQSILYTLRNRTYLGEIIYDGKSYPGKHPPIIDQLLFDQVQNILGSESANHGEEYIARPKRAKRQYLLAGLLRCAECGKFMTPANAKSGAYFYYRCTDNVNCKNRVSAPKIEDAIVELLSHEAIDTDFIRGFRDELETIRKERGEALRPEFDQVLAAERKAKKEREQIVSLLLGDNLTPKNILTFNRRLESVTEELETLTARKEYLAAEMHRSDNDLPNGLERLASEMLTLHDLMKNLPAEAPEWREIITTYLRKITLSRTGDISVEFNVLDGTSKDENGSLTWIRTKTK